MVALTPQQQEQQRERYQLLWLPVRTLNASQFSVLSTQQPLCWPQITPPAFVQLTAQQWAFSGKLLSALLDWSARSAASAHSHVLQLLPPPPPPPSVNSPWPSSPTPFFFLNNTAEPTSSSKHVNYSLPPSVIRTRYLNPLFHVRASVSVTPTSPTFLSSWRTQPGPLSVGYSLLCSSPTSLRW